MYPEQGRIAQMYHDRDTFDFSEARQRITMGKKMKTVIYPSEKIW